MSENQSSQPGTPEPVVLGSTRSPLPWWVLVIVITCVFLLTAGGVIAIANPSMLVGSGQEINGAVRVYAGYLVSRNLAIATMLLGALLMRARRTLSVVMVLTALVQILDAGMDCLEERWTLVPGVLVMGILLVVGASRIARQRLWKIAFWRDLRERA